jgi:hypothetical protein
MRGGVFGLDGHRPDLIKDDATPPSAPEANAPEANALEANALEERLLSVRITSFGSVFARASGASGWRVCPRIHGVDAFNLTASRRDSKMSQGVEYAGAD